MEAVDSKFPTTNSRTRRKRRLGISSTECSSLIMWSRRHTPPVFRVCHIHGVSTSLDSLILDANIVLNVYTVWLVSNLG
jgi:hypothetical protein